MIAKLLTALYGVILSLAAAISTDDPLVTVDPKLNEAVIAHPDDPRAYLRRGNAWLVQQQFQRALADYDRCLAIKFDCVDARFNRAVAFRMQHEYTRALDDYNALLQQHPDDVDALNNRAIIYCLKNFTWLGVNDFNRALQIDPHNARVQRNLQRLKEITSQQDTRVQKQDQFDLEDAYIRFGDN